MSFALPESLRDYIDERVRTGDYGNTSEYLRDLIRRLRNRGERVIFFLPGQVDHPAAMGCDRRIEARDGQWVVVPLDEK